MIDKNPKNVRQTMIQQNKDIVGIYGTARIDYLKELFIKIIDNIVPFHIKVFLFQFTSFKMTDWLKLKEIKKKDLNTPITSLKDIKVLQNYKDNNCTSLLVDYIKNNGNILKQQLDQLKLILHQLVRGI